MKNFKISQELRPFVEDILDRRGIPYIERKDSLLVDKSVSGRMFHKIVVRARCEKRNEEENLPLDTTYFLKKVESIDSIKCDNPDFQFFMEM